ncbi:5-(carboxyamino)imidazole ribonucleotide synthase [Rhodoluna sp.]|uniref:5-(carboxyamino)imidazole ribonucleotide synthase n=1 Tax=Rhodoluna sp. TaxID=1969481 RepID=UPI0025E9D7D8|nr:5-(carboxyamino)imidazole ribonucleotide synthase [Rhodoluna sp.]
MTELRLGVIGGGQLARMMTPPAINLGINIKVLAEAEGSSAALATTQVGDYNQLSVVREFAKTVDVITFDHEHVPLAVLEALEAEGVSVQPPSKALAFAQNKLSMRKRLGALGMPMPDWAEIQDAATLSAFIEAHDGVAILKTPIGGYDGKGVRVVRSAEDAADWLANLANFGGSLLAEEKVDFVRELAQLSARRPSGEFLAWPLVETQQENGVCSVVLAPAPEVSKATLDTTAEIAKAVAEGLGVTGVLSVEMFEARDGRILINELAMRPHNSGHFSIEGSVTSQFEQHIRAVLDLPLGSTQPHAKHAVMVNLLGVDDKNDFIQAYGSALAAHPEAKVHTYGKSARAGRKMGHVTVIGDSAAHALAEAKGAAAVLLRG